MHRGSWRHSPTMCGSSFLKSALELALCAALACLHRHLCLYPAPCHQPRPSLPQPRRPHSQPHHLLQVHLLLSLDTQGMQSAWQSCSHHFLMELGLLLMISAPSVPLAINGGLVTQIRPSAIVALSLLLCLHTRQHRPHRHRACSLQGQCLWEACPAQQPFSRHFLVEYGQRTTRLVQSVRAAIHGGLVTQTLRCVDACREGS